MATSLELLDNAELSPRADINFELCHIDWQHDHFIEHAKLAHKAAMPEVNDYRRRGFHVSTCVLFDDKRLRVSDHKDWMLEKYAQVPEVFADVDYLILESSLVELSEHFFSLLDPSFRNTVKKEFKRYIGKFRRTACSHDIAIWHTMRLGLLGPVLPVYRMKKRNPNSGLISSFVAKRTVVSALLESDREQEERADADILQYLRPGLFDDIMIQRRYYRI